jgi:hypothetical protein
VTVAGGRPAWDFDFAPLGRHADDGVRPESDLVIASTEDLDAIEITQALSDLASNVAITPLFSSHPIFWTRIEASSELDRAEVTRRLHRSGLRYVASARVGSQCLAPALDFTGARPRQVRDWRTRAATTVAEPDTPWRWFLRAQGVDVARHLCGTGAGTHLAVVDNDGLDLDRIALDAEIPVGVASIPRAQSHAAMMLGWAVGARAPDGSEFRGVAPDASARFYCIPKPGADVWSLPLAIARAVDDGADVIVCPTYVEGQTSPMLDDALDFARRVGRGGRGSVVVMPTGREMSSPPGVVYSSLSLAVSDPASDPRVFCIGPSARDGGWFLWRDRRGALHPFANRGPAVRWLAPGDDLPYPFAKDDRVWHAESSGASGVASGVILLTLAKNPWLTVSELDRVLTETAVEIEQRDAASEDPVADHRDLLPAGRDGDGHDAKHGYGRLNATNACLAAADPVSLTLVRMGEMAAARDYAAAVQSGVLDPRISQSLARWITCRALSDTFVAHGLASVLRALRVWSGRPRRLDEQPPGHLLRHVAIVARSLLDAPPPAALRDELSSVVSTLQAVQSGGRAGAVERAALEVIARATGWAAVSAGREGAKQSGMVLVGEPGPNDNSARARLGSA